MSRRVVFYSWLVRPPSQRSRYDEVLVRQIRRSFAESGESYGVRRVWPDVLAWGYGCGRERVARLMRQETLQARPPRRRLPRDLGERPVKALAPNKLARQFAASRPDERWVADLTYIWDCGGLVVSGGGAGFVLTARGGLVDAVTDECGVGHRCPGDGVMATPAGSGLAASFRPGQPIHECAVSAPVGTARD